MDYENFCDVLIGIGAKRIENRQGIERVMKLHSIISEVTFEWYPNVINTYIGNIHIRCDNISISSIWKNKEKKIINLELKNGKVICIIPLSI